MGITITISFDPSISLSDGTQAALTAIAGVTGLTVIGLEAGSEDKAIVGSLTAE